MNFDYQFMFKALNTRIDEPFLNTSFNSYVLVMSKTN